MANWQGYDAIKAEAERVGWPKHWRTDLTRHDRGILSRPDAPERFGWMLRDCGTHLFVPADVGSISWAQAAVKVFGDDQRCYWFDGLRLTEVSPEELLRRLTPAFWRDERGNRYRLRDCGRAGSIGVSHFANDDGPLPSPRYRCLKAADLAAMTAAWSETEAI